MKLTKTWQNSTISLSNKLKLIKNLTHCEWTSVHKKPYIFNPSMPQRFLKINDWKIIVPFFGNMGVTRIFCTEYRRVCTILKQTSPIEYQLELMLLLFLPPSIRSKACCALPLWCTSHPISAIEKPAKCYSSVMASHSVGDSIVCVVYVYFITHIYIYFVTNLTQASQIRSFFCP